MNTEEILRQLREERDRLDAAIRALEGVSGGTLTIAKRRGRPPGSKNNATSSTTAPKRRVMSAAARQKISEAARRRWAAIKRSGKKQL